MNVYEIITNRIIERMGSAFLMGTVGMDMPDIENATAYIQSWSKVLKGDSRAVVIAAAQAQKASDYILGKKNEVTA